MENHAVVWAAPSRSAAASAAVAARSESANRSASDVAIVYIPSVEASPRHRSATSERGSAIRRPLAAAMASRPFGSPDIHAVKPQAAAARAGTLPEPPPVSSLARWASGSERAGPSESQETRA